MNNQNNGGTKPIEDYGLIGNLVTAALVGRDGSIDWLCLPRFDSPACFAALLGTPENGRWLIAPRQSEEAPCRISRRYLPGTAVLETCFKTESAEAVLIDFMPLTDDEEKVDLVRIVRGVKGCMTFDMELVLRFAYGQVIPWVRRRDYGLSAIAGPDAVELHTAVALHGRDMRTLARFEVHEGDSVPFSLSYHRSHKHAHFVPDRAESLEKTASWWREWSNHCHADHDNRAWCEAIIRSVITLKLLTYAKTGGIIAAPTTSLPETIGGIRNWDYRYCWIRDGFHPLCAAQCRLSRGGAGLAPMADARRRRQPGAAADHVWDLGRAMAAGEHGAVARRLCRQHAGQGSATRPPSSVSSTSMAS